MSKKIKSKPIPKGSPQLVEEDKEEVKETPKPEKVEEKVKSEPKKRERAKTVKIDSNELISVRSVTKGALIYISKKTGLTVRWEDFGSEEYMEFGELVTMKSGSPRFLTEPFLIVDDVDAIDRLGLKDLYNKMINIDDMEGFYNQSLSEIEEQLKVMPKGNQELVVDTARQMIKDGTLYDIRKIKLIEDTLKVGLQISMD